MKEQRFRGLVDELLATIYRFNPTLPLEEVRRVAEQTVAFRLLVEEIRQREQIAYLPTA